MDYIAGILSVVLIIAVAAPCLAQRLSEARAVKRTRDGKERARYNPYW